MQKDQRQHFANWQHLYDQYATDILRTCYLLLKDKDAAEIAVQETFIQIGCGSGYLAPGNMISEKACLLQIAMDHCRGLSGKSTSGSPDLYKTVSHGGEEERLLRGIVGLDDKLRQTTLLFYYQQLTMREVAYVQRSSVWLVKLRLFQAVRQLRMLA